MTSKFNEWINRQIFPIRFIAKSIQFVIFSLTAIVVFLFSVLTSIAFGIFFFLSEFMEDLTEGFQIAFLSISNYYIKLTRD
jgi:hypothetical protein